MSDGVPGGQRNFSVWSILPLSGGVNIIVAKRFSGASPPACRPRRTLPGELTLHADRGSSMQSKPVALLLADLGVTKTHSRFGSIEDARLFCRNFFGYYNHEHRHSGIGLMTPAVVHHGRAEKLTTARRQTLVQAQRAHPERFVRGTPQPPVLPPQAWINPPPEKTTHQEAETATCSGWSIPELPPCFHSLWRVRDRSGRGPRRRHEPGDTNRGSLNATRGCLNVVDTFRGATSRDYRVSFFRGGRQVVENLQ